MNPCTRSLDLLDAELTEADRAHVAACPDCSLLLGSGALLPSPAAGAQRSSLPPPPTGALKALREQPHASSWRRPLWFLVTAQLAVLVGAGAFFAIRAPQPANTAPTGVLIALAAGILVHAVATGWLAFRPRWRVGSGPMLAGSGAVLILAILWGGSGLEFRPTWDGILHCVGVMSALTVLPLAAALSGLRELGAHSGRAYAAGLSAAGTGLLLLHGVCPEGTGLHLLLGHVAPWVMLAAAQIWMRGRVQTLSHAP